MDQQTFQAKYLSGLTPQQQTAVQAVEGPILLLAVPGSGKTTVLVHRLGYMLHCSGIPPENILTVTYTRAAAQDMRRRFCQLFPELAGLPLRFSTINAMALEIVGEYSRNFSAKPPFATIDNGQALALLRSLYQEITGEFPVRGVLLELQSAISYAKNRMLTDKDLPDCKPELTEFPSLYRAYREALVKNRQMDFDDQLVYARRILLTRPDVLALFQSRYRYFCVDEAQDTSLLQHELLRLLASAGQNLFMVGDEDQSIYGFRAAYPQALTRFEDTYPKGQVLYIQQNFRSAPQIVEAANRFVGRNLERYPKQMCPVRQEEGTIEVIRVSGQREQHWYLRAMAPGCDRETAILYRNNESCIPLLDFLERQGIPYHYAHQENSFFSGRVVTDVVNFIRFANAPLDEELFLSIYSRLPLYLTRDKALQLCAACRRTGIPMLELLDGELAAEHQSSRAGRILRQLERLKDASATDGLDIIENGLGYRDHLSRNNLSESPLTALGWIAREEPTALRLVERLAELEGALRSHQNGGCLHLSTIHSSKGLEYEQVYLLDVMDGTLPRVSPELLTEMHSDPSYQEERRLFYVAMTRAKQGLHLFLPMQGNSAFVEEIIADLPRERSASPMVGKRCRHAQYGMGLLPARGWNRCLVRMNDRFLLLPAAEVILEEPPAQKKKPLSLLTVKELPAGSSGSEQGDLHLAKGDAVTHRVFGVGYILSQEGDRVTISFGGAPRTFSLRMMLEKGLLEIK